MKILFLVHQFYPEYQAGTEKFVHNCALMAQMNGNKVKVITYSFYEDSYFEREEEGILSKDFIYQGIPVLAFKHKNTPLDLNYSLENEASYEFAKRILSIESPNVIHVGHPMRVHQFIRAAKESGIPYIITLTDFFLLCPKVILAPNRDSLCSGPQKGNACNDLCSELDNSFIRNRLRNAEQILNGAHFLIAPSKFVAQIFSNEFNKMYIQIINHGIRYKDINENKKIYKTEDPLVFGYTGNISYHKGVHILIKAFSNIKDKNIKLFLYGSGEDAYLSKLKEIANGDSRIFFLGTFSAKQLSEIYQKIDVLVTPSICYENYSFVIHEALASNVPVIVSELGGLGERVKDGFNGLTFKPGDTGDLFKKMSYLIRNHDLLNKMKENIRKEMIVPSIEQEAYKYNKIYNHL